MDNITFNVDDSEPVEFTETVNEIIYKNQSIHKVINTIKSVVLDNSQAFKSITTQGNITLKNNSQAFKDVYAEQGATINNSKMYATLNCSMSPFIPENSEIKEIILRSPSNNDSAPIVDLTTCTTKKVQFEDRKGQVICAKNSVQPKIYNGFIKV